MALAMPIPPWLQSRPAEHAEASQAGLREGLAAAQIWANANAESARLAEAARRTDMQAALDREALQEKSIYEAQKLAVDREYNKASIAQAQAKLEQTKASAADKAQQWAMTHALNVTREADTEQGRLARQAQAKLNQENLERHRRAMEAKQTEKPFKLSPTASVDDDLLKQRIVKINSEIEAANKLLAAAKPKNKPALQKGIDDLLAGRDELVVERKRLRNPDYDPRAEARIMEQAAEGTTNGGLRYSAVQKE